MNSKTDSGSGGRVGAGEVRGGEGDWEKEPRFSTTLLNCQINPEIALFQTSS